MKNPVENYIEKRSVMPLISWDIFSQFDFNNQSSNNITQLDYFSKIYKWNNNIKEILRLHKYEALVLTDKNKKILWVNDGFTKMTGYSKEHAINKTPHFLQGPKTTEKSIQSFRKKLSKDLPFKEVVVNYKKDGEEYNCEVTIIPLTNKETTHYLALERAV